MLGEFNEGADRCTDETNAGEDAGCGRRET